MTNLKVENNALLVIGHHHVYKVLVSTRCIFAKGITEMSTTFLCGLINSVGQIT